MKFLLSLSLIPLLLLTNVSVAEDLPLPIYGEESSTLHKYQNPTVKGAPLLALLEGEPNSGWDKLNIEIIKKRANDLCVFLGHNKTGIVLLEEDVQYRFEGKAYFEGEIVDIKAEYWDFWTHDNETSAIFKVLRCVD